MKENNELEFLLNHLSEENLKNYANKHLSQQKQEQLEDILSDKSKINSLLSSKEAGELMKKLKGNSNGQH